MFKYILALACLFCLFSCSSVKKATKHFNKGIAADKPTMAKLSREAFPCITSDSVTITETDTLWDYIECPEVTTGYEPARIDTIIINGKPTYITRTVKVPRYTIIKTIRTVLKIKDVADSIVWEKEKDVLNKDLAKANRKVASRTTTAIIFASLFLLLLLVVVLYALNKIKKNGKSMALVEDGFGKNNPN